jgi:hypothetical protein
VQRPTGEFEKNVVERCLVSAEPYRDYLLSFEFFQDAAQRADTSPYREAEAIASLVHVGDLRAGSEGRSVELSIELELDELNEPQVVDQ